MFTIILPCGEYLLHFCYFLSSYFFSPLLPYPLSLSHSLLPFSKWKLWFSFLFSSFPPSASTFRFYYFHLCSSSLPWLNVVKDFGKGKAMLREEFNLPMFRLKACTLVLLGCIHEVPVRWLHLWASYLNKRVYFMMCRSNISYKMSNGQNSDSLFSTWSHFSGHDWLAFSLARQFCETWL